MLTLATIRQAADRRRLQALYDELSLAHDELQALHRQARQLAVETEERNRLAREIHDSLAHYLTVVNLQLEAAEKLGERSGGQGLEQVRRARRLTISACRRFATPSPLCGPPRSTSCRCRARYASWPASSARAPIWPSSSRSRCRAPAPGARDGSEPSIAPLKRA